MNSERSKNAAAEVAVLADLPVSVKRRLDRIAPPPVVAGAVLRPCLAAAPFA